MNLSKKQKKKYRAINYIALHFCDSKASDPASWSFFSPSQNGPAQMTCSNPWISQMLSEFTPKKNSRSLKCPSSSFTLFQMIHLHLNSFACPPGNFCTFAPFRFDLKYESSKTNWLFYETWSVSYFYLYYFQ